VIRRFLFITQVLPSGLSAILSRYYETYNTGKD
jgi:hypothetical protein